MAETLRWSFRWPLWAALLVLLHTGVAAHAQSAESLGVGMVTVDPTRPLYVYGVPGLDVLPDALSPQDSVTFRQGAHHAEVATAPPWFVPAVRKLDYDLLLLRALTLMRDWVEVVVDEQTGATRWVPREAVALKLWPELLLEVAAVEVLDPTANPIRSGPGEALPVRARSQALLRPLAVRGMWLRVGPSDLTDDPTPTGWIRWTDGTRLLIVYSLLS